MFAFRSFSLALLPFVFAATTIDVQVGLGALQFSPEAVYASPGDQVVFHFHPKNHTVTQSSFANPCGLKAGGFNSGFNPVPAGQTYDLPTFNITVNDTEPIWVYCAQNIGLPSSHCGAGMVFAINCGPDGAKNSFTNFKNAALAYGASLSALPNPSATAAYGGYTVTIPPPPTPTLVTKVISLGPQVWTTTYNSYPNSPDPTPVSLEGQVIKVKVGSGSLAFDPPRVSARPRDTIIFEFFPKNHTVTQSTFNDPCKPFDANGTKGFDSGFLPVSAGATVTWNLTVNDTSPFWAYCKQGDHCSKGMVFSINSDESSGRNIQAFQNLAKTINSTALAASPAPSSTTSSTSSSAHVKVGGAGWILFVAGLFGAALWEHIF